MSTIDEKLIAAGLPHKGTRNGVHVWARSLTAQEQKIVLDIQLEHENQIRITSIKSEAGRIITERYPAWKQNNLTAQAVEAILNYLLGLPGTEEAKAQLTNSILGLGAWDWVKRVRAESDRLESTGLTKEDANWPE